MNNLIKIHQKEYQNDIVKSKLRSFIFKNKTSFNLNEEYVTLTTSQPNFLKETIEQTLDNKINNKVISNHHIIKLTNVENYLFEHHLTYKNFNGIKNILIPDFQHFVPMDIWKSNLHYLEVNTHFLIVYYNTKVEYKINNNYCFSIDDFIQQIYPLSVIDVEDISYLNKNIYIGLFSNL